MLALLRLGVEASFALFRQEGACCKYILQASLTVSVCSEALAQRLAYAQVVYRGWLYGRPVPCVGACLRLRRLVHRRVAELVGGLYPSSLLG